MDFPKLSLQNRREAETKQGQCLLGGAGEASNSTSKASALADIHSGGDGEHLNSEMKGGPGSKLTRQMDNPVQGKLRVVTQILPPSRKQVILGILGQINKVK